MCTYWIPSSMKTNLVQCLFLSNEKKVYKDHIGTFIFVVVSILHFFFFCFVSYFFLFDKSELLHFCFLWIVEDVLLAVMYHYLCAANTRSHFLLVFFSTQFFCPSLLLVFSWAASPVQVAKEILPLIFLFSFVFFSLFFYLQIHCVVFSRLCSFVLL